MSEPTKAIVAPGFWAFGPVDGGVKPLLAMIDVLTSSFEAATMSPVGMIEEKSSASSFSAHWGHGWRIGCRPARRGSAHRARAAARNALRVVAVGIFGRRALVGPAEPCRARAARRGATRVGGTRAASTPRSSVARGGARPASRHARADEDCRHRARNPLCGPRVPRHGISRCGAALAVPSLAPPPSVPPMPCVSGARAVEQDDGLKHVPHGGRNGSRGRRLQPGLVLWRVRARLALDPAPVPKEPGEVCARQRPAPAGGDA